MQIISFLVMTFGRMQELLYEYFTEVTLAASQGHFM